MDEGTYNIQRSCLLASLRLLLGQNLCSPADHLHRRSDRGIDAADVVSRCHGQHYLADCARHWDRGIRSGALAMARRGRLLADSG